MFSQSFVFPSPACFFPRKTGQTDSNKAKEIATNHNRNHPCVFLNPRRLKGSVALLLGLGLKLRIGGRKDRRLSKGLQWQPVISLEPCPRCTAPLFLRALKLSGQQYSLQSKKAAGLAVPYQLVLVRICISFCLWVLENCLEGSSCMQDAPRVLNCFQLCRQSGGLARLHLALSKQRVPSSYCSH